MKFDDREIRHLKSGGKLFKRPTIYGVHYNICLIVQVGELWCYVVSTEPLHDYKGPAKGCSLPYIQEYVKDFYEHDENRR